MSRFFTKKQLRETVKNLLKEKKCKNSEEEYLSCVEMLQSILRSGEACGPALAEIVEGTIANFHTHIDLGIIVKGKFSPIDCHLAARHNVVAGNFVSGNQFPVLKETRANKILEGPATARLPLDCIWETETQTILHARCYYLRHIDELMGISNEEIHRLELTDVFRQNLHKIG